MTTPRAFKIVIGCLVGVVLLSCLGLFAPVEAFFTLLMGWPFYLAKVLPQVRLNLEGLATGLVCLVGFGVGSHLFLSWLHGAIRAPEPGRWRKAWTARLVLTVVLMFTAGLAAAGVAHQVGWLVTAPRRLVAGLSLTAARRAQSVNYLKQIGLGALQYGEDHGFALPPGLTVNEEGEPLHSWQTLILPWMKVDDRIDLNVPWDDPANASALRADLDVFQIPGVEPRRDAQGRGLSHYEGNVRVLGRLQALRLVDVPDGTSNTILAGESGGGYRPWREPGHWRDPADGINRSLEMGLGGPFPGGANVLMLDGSVRFLKNSINPGVLKALSTPAGGESISPDAY